MGWWVVVVVQTSALNAQGGAFLALRGEDREAIQRRLQRLFNKEYDVPDYEKGTDIV